MTETLYYDVDGILLDFAGPFAEYWNEGLDQKYWNGNKLDKNPITWSFGSEYDVFDINKALDLFHSTHDHLPIMHPDISNILRQLKSRYVIELVTAYPNEKKRIENLLHHKIPYDKITCNVNNKLDHIKKQELDGSVVVAIFEDGPHHLDKLLPHYGNKVWAPRQWNYLDQYKSDCRIMLYNDPHEWMKLLEISTD